MIKHVTRTGFRPLARAVALAAATLAATAFAPAMAAWEPTKPVEFIVPAGTGGGADQMARLIQGIVVKHKLMKESLVVVNKAGGAGAEGFLAVKDAKGDPNKIIITLSNLFTTPMATGVPFNWRDMTPVSMMALDQFVLWVNAESPHKTAKEFIAAAKTAAADAPYSAGQFGIAAHQRHGGVGHLPLGDPTHARDHVAQPAEILVITADDMFGHGLRSFPLSRSGR